MALCTSHCTSPCTSPDFEKFLRLIKNSDTNPQFFMQCMILVYISFNTSNIIKYLPESIFINILVSTLYQHFCIKEKLWYIPNHPDVIYQDTLTLSSYSLNKIKCPCSCRNMGRMFRRLYNYQLNHIEDYKSQKNRWQIDNIDDFIYIHTKILKWWKRDNINYLEVLRRTFTPNETYQIIKILDSCNCCLRHQCDRDKI